MHDSDSQMVRYRWNIPCPSRKDLKLRIEMPRPPNRTAKSIDTNGKMNDRAISRGLVVTNSVTVLVVLRREVVDGESLDG
jgi:hypothetical protein